MSDGRYVELQVASHFSFLRGASSCEELFAQAALLGIEALAIVDRNSLAGVVRAHEAATTTGVRLIVGCRLDLDDGMSVLVYPTDRPAYARLCRLLSLGKKRGGKAKIIAESCLSVQKRVFDLWHLFRGGGRSPAHSREACSHNRKQSLRDRGRAGCCVGCPSRWASEQSLDRVDVRSVREGESTAVS